MQKWQEKLLVDFLDEYIDTSYFHRGSLKQIARSRILRFGLNCHMQYGICMECGYKYRAKITLWQINRYAKGSDRRARFKVSKELRKVLEKSYFYKLFNFDLVPINNRFQYDVPEEFSQNVLYHKCSLHN